MMREWIVRTFFQDYLDAVLAQATRQGSMDAFKKAHADIMETMLDDTEKKAQELAQQKLAEMLSVIDERMIVTVGNHGVVLIGGERATESQLANLRSEAEAILQMDIWHVLYETPKKLAEKAMFVDGKEMADLVKGRAMLYTLATQKKILDTFKGFAQQKPITPPPPVG